MIKISAYPFPKNLLVIKILLGVAGVFWFSSFAQTLYAGSDLKLNDLDYFEARGLNIFVFSNWYDVNFFSDSKLNGIEIIHHEVRTATNGDVRLQPTPEQWDPIPEFVNRRVNKKENSIEAFLAYPDYDFNYAIKAQAQDGRMLLSVSLDKPLPKDLIGRAGFNLEFLPAAYFGKTNLIYNPKLKSYESNSTESGNFDDRWAFTSKSMPLNYGSIAALAAASRALRGYSDPLADECLTTAKKVWDEEHSHEPILFRACNTSGGQLEAEELSAAVKLLICTKDAKYVKRISELWPTIEKRFAYLAALAVRAMPYMDKSYSKKLENLVRAYKDDLDKSCKENPFGVPISTGGWAGSGWVVLFANTNYILHKAFPKIVGPEYTLRGLNYLYGCHPGSDISFVSAVGTHSKKIAYGNNRADFSFIAGGVVPGVLIVKPDFPENKEDWPFIWAENEYTIGNATAYIFLVNAANDLLNENK